MDVNPSSQRNPLLCAACQSSLASAVCVHRGEAFLVQCRECGSWTYFPRPDIREQEEFHNTPQYFQFEYFVLRRRAQNSINRRCRNVFHRIGKCLDVDTLQGKRILDIGCDTGGFLTSAARQFDIKAVGIDVSSHAVKIANERGIEAYKTSIENAPAHLQNFVMMTAIDVVEHVVFPEIFFKQAFSRLRPGGVLYVETPNILSAVYQAGLWGSRLMKGVPHGIFERLFPPEHVQYFTLQSVGDLALRCGFQVCQLQSRYLPFEDISATLMVRLGTCLFQLPDFFTRNHILLWGIFQKPGPFKESRSS